MRPAAAPYGAPWKAVEFRSHALGEAQAVARDSPVLRKASRELQGGGGNHLADELGSLVKYKMPFSKMYVEVEMLKNLKYCA